MINQNNSNEKLFYNTAPILKNDVAGIERQSGTLPDKSKTRRGKGLLR